MFTSEDLKSLFVPGKGHVVRSPNRSKKGYLKKSMFLNRISIGEQKQGPRECARRLRQIDKGRG